MIRRVGVVVLLALASAACAESSSDRSPPSESERKEARCTALRDRLVELRLAGVQQDRAQHQRALSAALGEPFLDTCEATYGEDAVTCALGAADHLAAERCLE